MDEIFMGLALKESEKCKRSGDVPVGAIIVKNNKVIAKGYNMRNKKNNTIMHAEVIAINKACKKLKNWRLEGCRIYVTLEPCPMCAGAILQARMDEIIYGAPSHKAGACGTILNILDIVDNDKLNHKVKIKKGVLEEECSFKISNFFKKLRNKK